MALFAVTRRAAISSLPHLRTSASGVVSAEAPQFTLMANSTSSPLHATRGPLRDATSSHDTPFDLGAGTTRGSLSDATCSHEKLCELAAGTMQISPSDAALILRDTTSSHNKPRELGDGRSPAVQGYPVTWSGWRANELPAHVARARSCSFQGRRQFSSTSNGDKPVIGQLMFTNYLDIVLEKWLDPFKYVKIFPLLREVKVEKLIREADLKAATTSRYELTEEGESIIDSILSLIAVNLMRGRNVAQLIRAYNLMVSTTHAGFSFKTTAMKEEPTGFGGHHLPYKAALRLIRQMLNASVGGTLVDEELPGGLLNLLDLLGNAECVDKRLITCHASILKPQALQQLIQRIDLILVDECNRFGTESDVLRRDVILGGLPYLDTSNSFCFHDQHPIFEYWLDFRFKESKKRFKNPAKIGPAWSEHAAGMSLVRLHRHGLLHPYGAADVAPEVPYDIRDVLKLFKFRFSKYPAAAQDGFSRTASIDKLDMRSLCPEKSDFAGWSDVQIDETGKTVLIM